MIELANEHNIEIQERLFTPQEAYEADEAFMSSATTFVLPIVEIDGNKIGDGKPGEIFKKMRKMYIESALKIAGVKI